jgi:hypothetical protein
MILYHRFSLEGTSLPKQPTFTVWTLVDGEYDLQQFRDQDRALSPTLPELQVIIDKSSAQGNQTGAALPLPQGSRFSS